MNIPAPDALPVSPVIFRSLEILLFYIHILLVDSVVGIGLTLAASRLLRAKKGLAALVEAPGRLSPTSFALSATIGVGPLLFTQVLYGQFFYTSSVLMAVYWILVIPVLILGYYALHIRAKVSRPEAPLGTATTIVAALALLYIAFAFTSNVVLMLNPGDWAGYAENHSGTILPLVEPTLYPRYFHSIVGAVAIGGLAMALVARVRRQGGDAVEERNERLGLRIFSISTMAEMLVGCWFLFALPRNLVRPFMGGAAYPTIALAVGAAAGVAALFPARAGKTVPTLVLALLSIFGMVLARDALRALYLAPYAGAAKLAERQQYGVFALFLGVLVVGVGLMAYMLRVGFRTAGQGVQR